ncbi:hypothetical protein D0T11_19060 [Hymenobacter rubripertinctus]|uniref:Uncharacterized protein n=1 Tax=Hymenobacter rubripertinctus TaxID=2029981 RepID=A0A418QMA7_9BACT|nr:hypothetical protein D0T11_19060 [Hymenobacter rubripertinctus]
MMESSAESVGMAENGKIAVGGGYKLRQFARYRALCHACRHVGRGRRLLLLPGVGGQQMLVERRLGRCQAGQGLGAETAAAPAAMVTDHSDVVFKRNSAIV